MSKNRTQYRTRRRINPRWHRVHGRRISGVLFEIDPTRAMIRIARGQRVDLVDLRLYGLQPVIDTVGEKSYNRSDDN